MANELGEIELLAGQVAVALGAYGEYYMRVCGELPWGHIIFGFMGGTATVHYDHPGKQSQPIKRNSESESRALTGYWWLCDMLKEAHQEVKELRAGFNAHMPSTTTYKRIAANERLRIALMQSEVRSMSGEDLLGYLLAALHGNGNERSESIHDKP